MSTKAMIDAWNLKKHIIINTSRMNIPFSEWEWNQEGGIYQPEGKSIVKKYKSHFSLKR